LRIELIEFGGIHEAHFDQHELHVLFPCDSAIGIAIHGLQMLQSQVFFELPLVKALLSALDQGQCHARQQFTGRGDLNGDKEYGKEPGRRRLGGQITKTNG
jgi:hypothetical protein